MSNELWFHALKVLDSFRSSSDSQDVFKLYEFNDETGILHKHKEHLESRFEEPQNAGVKIMYHELIKMLMDQDMRQSPEGFKQTRDVDKIGGFQELTNRLQFNLNERYFKNNIFPVFNSLSLLKSHYFDGKKFVKSQNYKILSSLCIYGLPGLLLSLRHTSKITIHVLYEITKILALKKNHYSPKSIRRES